MPGPTSTSTPATAAPSTPPTSETTAFPDVAKPSTTSYFSGLKAFTWGGSTGKDILPKEAGLNTNKLPPNASLDQLGEQNLREKSSKNGTDHRVSQWHGLNPKTYPPGCPPLTVHWFHAVDVPKRKPFNNAPAPPDKPAPVPKKYTPFSDEDSAVLEAAFQRIADEEERQISASKSLSSELNKARIPVNEDYLFDVDIQTRELAPAYWLGPTYDVRRGTWFTLDGSNLRPCEESLAVQLEDAYLRMKPWLWAKNSTKESGILRPKSRPQSRIGDDARSNAEAGPVSEPKPDGANAPLTESAGPEAVQSTQSVHLFGEYANLLVAYQDEKSAWVTTNDFISRMGGFLTGYKVIRGYKSPTTKSEGKGRSTSASSAQLQPQSTPPEPSAETENDTLSPAQMRFQALERQISTFGTNETREQEEEQIRQRDENEIIDDYQTQTSEERGRQIDHLILVTHGIGQRLGLRLDRVNFVHDVNTLRKTVKAVYSNSSDLQALNDELEKDTKNSRVQVLPVCWRHLLDFPRSNIRNKDAEGRAQRGREHDLGDVPLGAIDERDEAQADEEAFPSLDDITIDGIVPFRNFLTDLGLDVLLYQSEHYRAEIARIVAQECNRVYALFLERNPAFRGRVSLIGHSLGSAIMFDILCAQRDDKVPTPHPGPSVQRSFSGKQRHRGEHLAKGESKLQLDFDAEHFFSMGSPIGLFHLLQGNKIASRPARRMRFYSGAGDSDSPFVEERLIRQQPTGLSVSGFEYTSDAELSSPDDDPLGHKGVLANPFSKQGLSRPKLNGDVYNIFFSSDPIAYRLEPLVSPAMATLKPQPLPYTKKGLFSSTGAASQGLTNLGARVGQSVSGLWSSVSSGIANSLLNRHLGIDSSATSSSSQGQSTAQNLYSVPHAGGGGSAGGVGAGAGAGVPGSSSEGSTTPPAPPSVNPNLETLYSGFRKKTAAQAAGPHTTFSIAGMLTSGLTGGGGTGGGSTSSAAAVDREARRLRREEAKVRALNRNGRLDFVIQEGTFDNISFSFLSSLASHLLYWGDEDVAHFLMAQLLNSGGGRRGGGGSGGGGNGGGGGVSSQTHSPTFGHAGSNGSALGAGSLKGGGGGGPAGGSDAAAARSEGVPRFPTPPPAAVMAAPGAGSGSGHVSKSSSQLRLTRTDRKRIFGSEDDFGGGTDVGDSRGKGRF